MTSTSTGISKKFKCDGTDFISKLPQSVICHILSRLPSKDAVRTCILSKDWVYKWTSVYNIDIDDCNRSRNFTNFVDKMLRPSHDLKSFRFSCQSMCSSTRLAGWISTALRRNAESIEIGYPHGLVLSRGFTNNTSLRNLKLMPSPPSKYAKLSPSCSFRVTDANCFPNLTCLYLEEVEILKERTDSDCLSLTLPVLRTLELLSCKWSNAKLVEIHSPALKTLMCKTGSDTRVNGCLIKIYGAQLVKFESCGDIPDKIILIDSVVITAALMNRWDSDLQCGLQVRKLVKGFSGIRDLNLSSCVCEAIAQSKQELPLPRYCQLRRLVISIGDAKMLFELLHSTPFLRILEIELDQNFAEVDCDVVDHVPYCIVSRLEEVKIKYYSDTCKKPVHLAKFLLKNGKKLKKLYLRNMYGFYNYKSSIEVVEQLLASPRASACVGIAAS